MVEKNLVLCSLPFMHLSTHPNGLVTPCCNANYENGISFSKTGHKVLTLGQDSIEDIINSDSFIEMRRKMLNNERPIECAGCYKSEDNGLVSKRIEENIKYLSDITEFDCYIPKINLKFIELRLGNMCNSKCLTCNPMSSSKWESDVKKFTEMFDRDHYNYKKFQSNWYMNKDWYDELLLYCDDLEEIYINGGEPTLIKEHYYFLEKLIELKKEKNISLIYNINCTNVPVKFLKLLRQFKHVELRLSIDDIEDRNYYIRYPSKWNDVFNNYKKLKNENFDITITQTISNLNICNVGNFREFFRNDRIDYNFVYNPKYLHVSNLTPKLKELAYKQIDMLDEKDKGKFKFEIESKTYNEKDFDTALRFFNMMDKIRNLKITEYLNEYENSNMF